MHTIFITGGTGCIGSVTISKLLQNKEVGKIVIATRSNNADPLKLWLGEDLDQRLEFVSLDGYLMLPRSYRFLKNLFLLVRPQYME